MLKPLPFLEAVDVILDHGFDIETFYKPREQAWMSKRSYLRTVLQSETLLYPIIKARRINVADAIIKRCPATLSELGSFKNEHLSQEFGQMKPFHMCTIKGLYKGLELLIKHRADVNELLPGIKQSRYCVDQMLGWVEG